jgi:molybdopterin molybdotransferase
MKISCSLAHQRIFENISPGGTECLPLSAAAGRILREPVVADRDAPPFDRVMMDGFAVKTGQSPYSIQGRVYAGDPSPRLRDSQSAIAVMTGCVLPEGADAVVPVEDARVKKALLQLETVPAEGQFIHRRGNGGRAGRVVLAAGQRLNPARLAIAATEGAVEVVVNARIRLLLITTGDEVVPIETAPEAWQIRGSHAIALQAMLGCGGDVDFQHLHVKDQASSLESVLAQGLASSDFIVVCGGMSKGDRDYVPGCLSKMKAAEHFHFVAQRPGKPMGFWTSGHTAIFGLPGNPLAVLCSARRHVVPALARWRGCEEFPVPRVPLTADLLPQNTFTTFHPVRMITEGAAVLPVANSGELHALAESDGFIEISPGEKPLAAGSSVPFYPWL